MCCFRFQFLLNAVSQATAFLCKLSFRFQQKVRQAIGYEYLESIPPEARGHSALLAGVQGVFIFLKRTVIYIKGIFQLFSGLRHYAHNFSYPLVRPVHTSCNQVQLHSMLVEGFWFFFQMSMHVHMCVDICLYDLFETQFQVTKYIPDHLETSFQSQLPGNLCICLRLLWQTAFISISHEK